MQDLWRENAGLKSSVVNAAFSPDKLNPINKNQRLIACCQPQSLSPASTYQHRATPESARGTPAAPPATAPHPDVPG